MNSKSAKIPRSPRLEVGAMHTRKKEASQRKRENRLHFSDTPLTEWMHFHAAASSEHMADLVYKPNIMSASRHWRHQQHKNTDSGLINHWKRLVYFNTLSRRRDNFIWFQEEFPHSQNGCWTEK